MTRFSFSLALFVLGSVLAVATAHQFSLGAGSIGACDAARERGDTRGAVMYAKRAAEARAPGSPYPEMGYARLASIARSAEAQGDWRTAQAAWRGVRAAALATRAAGGANPHLAPANEALVRLATLPQAAAGRTETEPAVPALRLAESLARDPMPPTWVLVLLAAGAAMFVVAGLRLAMVRRLTDAEGRVSLALGALGLGLYLAACMFGS